MKATKAKSLPAIKSRSALSSLRVLPVLITVAVVALAAALGYQAWQYYMGTPWTRDGTVRAYVVKVAPQVAGEIVKLPIADNQFVHKGDLLMLIDPRNYAIAVRQAQAASEQARAVAENANAEMIRREKLNDIAVTMEERQTYISQAATAEASYQSTLANLDQARINLGRTQVRSPVNGYVTNLAAQLGDYADVGTLQLSVVNSDSYWVDAYFEETALGRIQEGDAATIKLMGYSPLLRGRVQGLSRGVDVPNAAPDASGLASVNPIFTFVRLAQRVPVRIHIDEVPQGVKLVAGLTATVQIEPYQAPSAAGPAPAPGKVSEAKPTTTATLVADGPPLQAAPARAAPEQNASRAPAQAVPSQADSRSPPPAAAQAPPQAPQQQNAPQQQTAPPPKAPNAGAGQLDVSAPPSAAASNAAAAASADLKMLEEQIAANPPSGPASSPGGANGKDSASADLMPPSEYLGQTFDLEGGQSVTQNPRPRSPDTIRRRAHSRWRRYSGQH
ncbi:MAG TPA: HlyD family secretion protein [Roseiarcus sp.]